MKLQGGSRVESRKQGGLRVRAELHGGSREESGITGRVKGSEWNYREVRG